MRLSAMIQELTETGVTFYGKVNRVNLAGIEYDVQKIEAHIERDDQKFIVTTVHLDGLDTVREFLEECIEVLEELEDADESKLTFIQDSFGYHYYTLKQIFDDNMLDNVEVYDSIYEYVGQWLEGFGLPRGTADSIFDYLDYHKIMRDAGYDGEYNNYDERMGFTDTVYVYRD